MEWNGMEWQGRTNKHKRNTGLIGSTQGGKEGFYTCAPFTRHCSRFTSDAHGWPTTQNRNDTNCNVESKGVEELAHAIVEVHR